MAETFKLLALGGDGIGPEVTACGLHLVEAAVTAALDAGHRTPDIGGEATTEGLTGAVIEEFRR